MKIAIPRYASVLGLPADGQAIVLSNSEREDLACPLRWWFRYVERLKTPESEARRFGTMWHLWMEEVHLWWMRTDSPWPVIGSVMCPYCATGANSTCDRCGGTGEGVLVRMQRALYDAVRQSEQRAGQESAVWFTREDADDLLDRVGRAAESWLRKYGTTPYDSLQVVGVEVQIAREILNPRTGKSYRPETLLVRHADGSMRLAATGEASGVVELPEGAEVVSVRWPWYQVGTLDGVLRHRTKPVLHVGEWKSSADPNGLAADLTVDPQTTGYVWLLDQPWAESMFGGKPVGSVYDVTNSCHRYDPERLKPKPTKAEPNPPVKFSVAKNRTVPSWRFVAALRAVGLDERDPHYAEHILHLASHVDPKLHLREMPSCGQEMRDRYADEIFAIAVRLAGLRRAVARAVDQTDLSVATPRVPICRLPGGGCAYRAPCLLDGDDARRKYEIGPALLWR